MVRMTPLQCVIIGLLQTRRIEPINKLYVIIFFSKASFMNIGKSESKFLITENDNIIKSEDLFESFLRLHNHSSCC